MTLPSGDGNPLARILIVGEAWGAEEERVGRPFQGASGQELQRMLQDAGILWSDTYRTNVVNARPKNNDIGQWLPATKKDITSDCVPCGDRLVKLILAEGVECLRKEIALVKPSLIITLGNTPLWALTGKRGVLKWRGSHLSYEGIPLIPAIHPAAVLRQWDFRPLVVQDFRRAKRVMETHPEEPKWDILIQPTFTQAEQALRSLWDLLDAGPRWIETDLETRYGHISCVGLSWSDTEALVIPFVTQDSSNYWPTVEEEAALVWLLYKILTHPNCRGRLQNGLFDSQYTYRHWHFVPRIEQDTMISQHSLWAALPKSLDFLASMYCKYYVQWKPDGKSWHDRHESDEEYWRYNGKDDLYTREVGTVLNTAIDAMGMREVERFQQSMLSPVLRAMLLGVRIDPLRRNEMAKEVTAARELREEYLYKVLGHSINIASPKQMQALFYEDLKVKPVLKKVKTPAGLVYRPTVDDEALQQIARREPLVAGLCHAVADMRTLGKLLNDFVLMPLDVDGRMRCSFNIAGDAGTEDTGAVKSAPYSYRLSSSTNAFGSGGNLQTIPSEKSKSAGKAKARGTLPPLPNIRNMYIPDPGMTFFDGDLDRADLQVVVWEADDPMLKQALRMGADIHLLNVYSLDGQEPPPLEELVETHPRYLDHRAPRKHKREFAKVFCHATNYLGKAQTVAGHTGRLVHEIERSQRAWFGAHPGILAWHNRVIEQVNKYRFIENRFGYRWYIFDRIDGQLYPKAVAWIPQSTVGGVVNRIWKNVYDNCPDVQVLIQVHDSLAGQFPTARKTECIAQINQNSRIVIPYEDPLIIPFGLKTSESSWGECK